MTNPSPHLTKSSALTPSNSLRGFSSRCQPCSSPYRMLLALKAVFKSSALIFFFTLSLSYPQTCITLSHARAHTHQFWSDILQHWWTCVTISSSHEPPAHPPFVMIWRRSGLVRTKSRMLLWCLPCLWLLSLSPSFGRCRWSHWDANGWSQPARISEGRDDRAGKVHTINRHMRKSQMCSRQVL